MDGFTILVIVVMIFLLLVWGYQSLFSGSYVPPEPGGTRYPEGARRGTKKFLTWIRGEKTSGNSTPIDEIEKGIAAEENVKYALKGLSTDYMQVHDVRVMIPRFREYQQFDHIVIGSEGVYHIETKSTEGQISFSSNGEYLINGRPPMDMSKENPINQMHRHQQALLNFIQENGFENIQVIGILCYGTKKGVSIGQGSTEYLTVKADNLVTTINNSKKTSTSTEQLTKAQITRLHNILTSKNSPKIYK